MYNILQYCFVDVVHYSEMTAYTELSPNEVETRGRGNAASVNIQSTHSVCVCVTVYMRVVTGCILSPLCEIDSVIRGRDQARESVRDGEREREGKGGVSNCEVRER